MNQDVFEKYSVPKAMLTLATPTVLSMLVTILYNMADTFFVGQTGDANQVAAVSLTTPVFLMLMAVGNIFGIGGSAYISRLLGQGEKDKTKHVSSFCCYGCIVCGLFMMGLFLLGMPTILKLIGTSSNTYGFAKDYLTCIGYGAVFVVFSNAFGNVVRGEGAAKVSMIGMMIGTIVNIVLDPIMILKMDMGVFGAALATIIGNACAMIFYLIYFKRGKTILSIKRKDFMLKDGIFVGVVSVGIPASINNILMSVSNVVLNIFLVKYGDAQVAAMGVAQKVNILTVLLSIGVAMGVQPLIGYYYGAKRVEDLKKTMAYAMGFNFIMGSMITVLYVMNSQVIVSAFIKSQEVLPYGVQMLRALMVSAPVLGIMFVFNFTFQAMGKPKQSLILSLGRQGLFFLPVLLIADRMIGLDGVVYAQPIADYASILISCIMFVLIKRELDQYLKD
ncbi:MAG: MATE family efflux transporter [Anaerostipes sp.]|jgi:multidrug efflux pump|nr:MATE family efflux transporter [Anaerostipes sp.]